MSLRNQIAAKLNAVNAVKTKEVGKRMPKIMICNVHKIESADELIKNMIDRNSYLQNVDDVENKITLLKSKPAAGGTVHYILKCDPQVRGLLHENKDKVMLQWGVYVLRDRYALICYHCQRYGHVVANCNHWKESAHCYKCAGLHSGKDCNSDVKKCINCMRQKKESTDHSANEGCCPIFVNELRSEIALIMASRDNSVFKCGLVNIQSVTNKTQEIRDLINDSDINGNMAW